MAATAADIAKLRLMVAEPTTTTYSDATLTTLIETYPLDTGYDLNAAARDVWQYKAASYVTETNKVSADGKSFDFGDLYQKAMKMVEFYSAKMDETYSSSGFGYLTRDDVDPYGEAELPLRPVI